MGGGAHAQLAAAMFELDKIDNYRGEDADVKCDPKPNARHSGPQRFMQAARRQW
jgi:hypothetical protein